MRGLILNKIASDIGDIVCVGIHALDIGVLNASCTARSSTITIGYVALAALAMVVFVRSCEIPSAGLNREQLDLPGSGDFFHRLALARGRSSLFRDGQSRIFLGMNKPLGGDPLWAFRSQRPEWKQRPSNP